jgi:FkbM family methyltransferase
VDIGANPIDGSPPYAGLLAEGLADVVGFEPNREALARLDAGKGPHETYLPWAMGDGGRHTLHICAAPGVTSLLRPNPAVLGLFHGFPEWGRVLATEEVDTVRLDEVPETEGVELLKLDIQGAELMALSRAEARLASTLVVRAEVEFLPLYEDQPLFAEVESHLRARLHVPPLLPADQPRDPPHGGGQQHLRGAEPAGLGGRDLHSGPDAAGGVGGRRAAPHGDDPARVLRLAGRRLPPAGGA